jgi:hypothetical protein
LSGLSPHDGQYAEGNTRCQEGAQGFQKASFPERARCGFCKIALITEARLSDHNVAPNPVDDKRICCRIVNGRAAAAG